MTECDTIEALARVLEALKTRISGGTFSGSNSGDLLREFETLKERIAILEGSVEDLVFTRPRGRPRRRPASAQPPWPPTATRVRMPSAITVGWAMSPAV